MRSLCAKSWLLSLAVSLGASATAIAAENPFVTQAEAIFDAPAVPFVEPISHEVCAPPSCDAAPGCDLACDAAAGEEGPDYWLGGDGFDLGQTIFGPESSWDIGGWFQFGYHNDNDGVFNTYPDHFQLQQGYLYVEKVADGSEGIGFGGRVDLLYGTDAQNTQSFGNNPGRFDFQNGWDHGVYGWAMPQLYGEVAYKKLSVKVGHFYTLLGYQVVPATGNFFYSIPYTFNFSEAFTHTGVLATYAASDNLTVYGGWTLGWDTGFDRLNGGSSFLGGASVGVTDSLTVTYILTAGNLGWLGEGYTHSIVADWVVNDKWEYVFQSDLVGVDTPAGTTNLFTGNPNSHYDTIGVNQYLFYTFSDSLKAGARVEWWKADGLSLYEMAYGFNIRPMANLLLRPEIRYNWSPEDAVFQGTPFDENTIFAMDMILTY